MSGSHRQRPATKNAYDALATPRVSNAHIGFHGDHVPRPSSEANDRRHRSRSSRRPDNSQHMDSMKMHHYQYQEDPQSKQQTMHRQNRLQQHHRNYSEERQTTSECSRSSNLTPRDDSIAHWCTPPRSNTSLERVENNSYDSRGRHYCDHVSNQQFHYGGKREGHRSKMKRSQSTGVADMVGFHSRSYFYNNSPYSKDDSYVHHMDADQDSKKSKSSKGLLSRASHKIKKRLVGASGSSSQRSGDGEKDTTNQYSVNVSTGHQIRGGRDPSPSGGSVEQRRRARSLSIKGGDVDDGTGQYYDDQGNLVEDFQSVDFSDMSTLESNFTHPIGENISGGVTWSKERQNAHHVVLDTPPRFPRPKGNNLSVQSEAYAASHGSHDSRMCRSHQQQSYPILHKSPLNGQQPAAVHASSEKRHVYQHNSPMKEIVGTDSRATNDGQHEPDQNGKVQTIDNVLGQQNEELILENSKLLNEVETMNNQQRDAESLGSAKSTISQLEEKVIRLEAELKKRDQDLNTATKRNIVTERELEKSNKVLSQLEKDLDSYKKECASHRDRVLQSERENAKMEQVVYNERKKVLSLEAENQMLLNLADEKIGNANNAEMAKQSEMDAYKEQCNKYRDRVIQLERKLITSESALEATGKMAAVLEDDKKAISAALDQRIAAAESIKIELEEKDAKLRSTQAELATLQSKISHMDSSKSKPTDSERTIVVLESENYNLLRKLDAQTSALERSEKEVTQLRQLESEYQVLKKQNEELQRQDTELREQLMNAQDAAFNTERLQKNVKDSETFISSLQNDLSATRANHHTQLLELRNKHANEIDKLADELQKEKNAKREAEKLNSSLEDEVLSLQTTRDQLEQQIAFKSKDHSDQTSKLMQQLDEMRERLSVSREEAINFKRECADKSKADESLIVELRASIEQQRDAFSAASEALENELKVKSEELRSIGTAMEEKDRELINLRSDLSLYEHRSTSDIDSLNKLVNKLKEDQQLLTSENGVLRSANESLLARIQATKLHATESIAVLKKERATLASDVQTLLLDGKAELIKYFNRAVLDHCREVENFYLTQTMNHQVALTSAHKEQDKIDRLLQEERSRSLRLQKSVDMMKDEKVKGSSALSLLSSKLCVPEMDVVDKVEDLQLELSEAQSQLATIGIDLTTTNSELAKINHEKHQLSLDIDHLNNVLELTSSQLKETEADAIAQNEKARGTIACLERSLADEKQAHADTRSAFETEMTSVTTNRENQLISVQDESKILRCDLDKATKECLDLNSRLDEIQNELATAKNDIGLLNDQLQEKVDTIHNLNELLSRASQEAVDDLANHYMKIEDELRAQLHAVKCEKEAIEKENQVQNEESLRVLEELQTAKEELSTCVDRLSQDLANAQKQVHTKELEIRDLRDKKSRLSEEHSNLMMEMDVISIKGSASSNQIRNLTSTIEKLHNIHASSEREYTAEVSRITDELIESYSAQIDELNKQLLEANSKINDLQASNLEHDCDLNMSIDFYKSELDNQNASHLKELKTKDLELSNLRNEVDKLASSKLALENVCSERDELIEQLKSSLRDALQNALKSDASKRESDDKLAEITDTLSSFDNIEECSSSLSGSLSGVLHLKSTIERLISDKQELELELAENKRQVAENKSARGHLESKLSTIIQINEKLRERSDTQQRELNNMNDEKIERSTDQKWMEDRLKTLQRERETETEKFRDIVSRMQKELEHAKQNEEDLMAQIKVLRQDCDIENLYKELLDKMKEKELNYESEIQKMTLEIDVLKESVASLLEENKTLVGAYDEANTNSSNLAQRLDHTTAHSNTLMAKLTSVEDELDALRRNTAAKDNHNDEMSTASSMASHLLHQTASDLDSTIKAIKKHHSSKMNKLQNELDEMRTRWKKSEQRVQELTKLLQDNAKVIDALHKKLRSKTKQPK